MRSAVLPLLVLLTACGRAFGDEPRPPPGPRTQVTAPRPETAPAQVARAAAAPGETPTEAFDPRAIDALLALPPSTSTSVGGPNHGSVEGAVALPLRGPGFRFGPRRDEAARYGTVEVVQALVLAAAAVAREHPGSELTIHDLGLEHGGPIPHHGSHRAGRDVDVLFYLHDAEGAPRAGIGVPIEPDLGGTDYGDLLAPDDDVLVRLDVARSWAFVAALLRDERAVVQRIFVVEHVREALLAHARRIGADAELVSRFEDTTCQPSYPHDDHFHIRFFCAADDVRAGCTDSAPIYPWHRDAMRRAGAPPVPQVVPRDRPRADVTTEAEARAAAPAMHETVAAFLARREAWRRQPHPGRRYCR